MMLGFNAEYTGGLFLSSAKYPPYDNTTIILLTLHKVTVMSAFS